MSLNGLFPLLNNNAGYKSIIAGLAAKRQRAVIVDAAKPFVMAGLYHEFNLPVLIVVPNAEDARKLVEELREKGVVKTDRWWSFPVKPGEEYTY